MPRARWWAGRVAGRGEPSELMDFVRRTKGCWALQGRVPLIVPLRKGDIEQEGKGARRETKRRSSLRR
jgi:hypothetical protein